MLRPAADSTHGSRRPLPRHGWATILNGVGSTVPGPLGGDQRRHEAVRLRRRGVQTEAHARAANHDSSWRCRASPPAHGRCRTHDLLRPHRCARREHAGARTLAQGWNARWPVTHCRRRALGEEQTTTRVRGRLERHKGVSLRSPTIHHERSIEPTRHGLAKPADHAPFARRELMPNHQTWASSANTNVARARVMDTPALDRRDITRAVRRHDRSLRDTRRVG